MPGKQRFKYIQSLGQKKQRDSEGVFLAEGPKIVGELIAAIPGQLREIFAVKDWINDHRSLRQIAVNEVSEDELRKISQLITPNKVLAVVSRFDNSMPVTKGRLSIVLDAIQDPGNLGTIIRVADWFGISQIICSTDSADVYNPKVVQATMGSIVRVKVFYTDLRPWLEQQRSSGIRMFAAALEGKDINKMGTVSEGLVIIGNESKGIQEEILQMANEKITIPRKGGAESLNAGVAAGIILSRLTAT